MKLVIQYEKTLKTYLLEELKSLGENFEEITEGLALIEADYKELNIKSFFIQRVGVFMGLHEELNRFKTIDYSKYLDSSDSFKVKCTDKNLCMQLGQFIKDSSKAGVSLDNPRKTFFAEKIKDKILLFLDTTGEKPLTLRGYASTSNESISSDAAAAIVKFSGWTPDKTMIDLYCNQGYIIIEALLLALNIPPGSLRLKNFSFQTELTRREEPAKIADIFAFSTTMNDVKNAKQNCQLAGVLKHVRFGSQELANLDYDLGENKIDFVISAPPRSIDMDKLFFQLEYIVKKGGVIVLYTSADISKYKDYNIELVEESAIFNKKLYKFAVKK